MILLPFSLAGRYRISAVSRCGVRRLLMDWTRNTILDGGLDMVAASSTWLDCVHVGTSGDAVDPAEQTTLIEPVAATANRVAANSAAASIPPYRGYSQITWRFAVGDVVGVIRELGVGPSTTLGSPLFSRTLVRDITGAPSSVRVLADEALEVQYELSVFAPEVDVIGTALIDGVGRGFKARAMLASTPMHWAPYRAASYASSGQGVRGIFTSSSAASAHSGAIGAATSSPAGSSAAASTVIPKAYVAGSHASSARFEWDFNAANYVDGIRSLSWRMSSGTGSGGNSLGAFQLEFDEPIMKVDTIAFAMELGIAWGRK